MNRPNELRVAWRMAKWWESAIMIALTGVFALLVRAGLRSTGPGVWPHVIIPPFGLWIYATLSTLVNRRKVVVTPRELVASNGPIPLRPRRHIAREDVGCAFHSEITALNDDGDSLLVFGHICGIETRTGAHVLVFTTFKDMESARGAAQRIADAFGVVSGAPIEVRHLSDITYDPADKRITLIWFGIVGAALIAGFVWDLVLRA